MKDMTPEQKIRYRLNLAIEEIIATENEYVQDLRILLSVDSPRLSKKDTQFIKFFIGQVFLEPLKKNQQDDTQPKLLTKMEMQSIFGNIEEIYKVATDFLRY